MHEPLCDQLPAIIITDRPASTPASRLDAGPGQVDLVAMVLAGLSPQSQAGYRKDLAALARFAGSPDLPGLIRNLFGLKRGEANAVAAAWIADQLANKIAPATVRRRFAAFLRVYSAGRRYELTEVTPEAELPRAERGDTTGPGKRGWVKMLEFAQDLASLINPRPERVRDLAVVLLLHDRGLRRGEVVGLDWPDDVDLTKPAVQVLGKGKRVKVWLTISDRAGEAIRNWLGYRGREPGPLFTRCDRAAKAPERLDGHAVNDLVKSLARRAGLVRKVRAHGLRHQAITDVLDAGHSVRDTMVFSRHVDPRTVMLYDDRRTDVGGDISKELGGSKRPRRKRR